MLAINMLRMPFSLPGGPTGGLYRGSLPGVAYSAGGLSQTGLLSSPDGHNLTRDKHPRANSLTFRGQPETIGKFRKQNYSIIKISSLLIGKTKNKTNDTKQHPFHLLPLVLQPLHSQVNQDQSCQPEHP